MIGSVASVSAALFAAYLIGGIPVAYVMGRLVRGIDIREHGSGNVGTTNAWRVLGPIPGAAVLALDVLKGVAAVLLAQAIAALPALAGAARPSAAVETLMLWLPVLAGLAAIAGHTYTPFLRFSGGKGIATAAGVLLVITPLALLILLVVFTLVVATTRMISAGSVVIALLYPLLVWLMYPRVPGAFPFAIVAAALVIWRHRGNIARMARGEERKVGWGRGSGEGEDRR